MADESTPPDLANTITFTVIEKPAAFSRQTAAASSRMGPGRGMLPENVKVWRDAIRTSYWMAIRQDSRYAHFPAAGEYLGPVGFVIELHGSMADIVNVCKEVEDALNGTAWGDDRQVVDARIVAPLRVLTERGGIKRPPGAETPGARITITLYDL